MPIQRRIAQLGFAKQTGQGAAAANPLFTAGLLSGRVIETDIQTADLNPTWLSTVPEGFDRTMVVPGVTFEVVATPALLGFLLYWMLGADVVTGTNPYTHTVTEAVDEFYVTLFGRYGSQYYVVSDAKLSELELTWDKVAALRVKGKAVGCGLDTAAASWSGGTLERPNGGYLSGAGGLFQVDGAGPGSVPGGSVKITRKIDPVTSAAQILPANVFPGELRCATSLKIIPNDTSLWRKVLTGSTSGTTVQSTPYYGALNLKWVMDTNTDLTVTVPRNRFLTAFPDVNTQGGPAEISLEGELAAPTSGAAITAAMRNAVVTY